MPIPWSENLLARRSSPCRSQASPAALIGAFIGACLAAPRRGLDVAPRVAPAALAMLAVMAVVWFGLQTEPEKGVRATVALTE